jgi:hypothetical protein
MQPSRREFVQWVTASGIALSLSRLALAEEPSFAARQTLPGRQRWNPAATGVGRIDGVAKVTGAKLYASDFRAADMPGWPATTSHAILVRAPDATHVYTGMDLGRLKGALEPAVVVTADDLARIGTRVPAFYAGDLLCPIGKTPLYLGQPVALLIFEHFDAFDQARLALRDGTFVRFGEETGPIVGPNYGAFRFTRVAGPTPDAPDVYSPIQAGWISPARIQDSALPVWSPLARQTPANYAKGAVYGEQIRAELAAKDPTLLVLDREFETQSVDPMFLEPEAGLAWFSGDSSKLEVELGGVALHAAEAVAFMLGKARLPSSLPINSHFAYMGGGPGGATIRPSLTLHWRGCSPGRPVRFALTLSTVQGAQGVAFKMRSQIGATATGKIRAFAADHVLRRRTCQLFAQRRHCGRGRRHRHLRRAQARRYHRGAALAWRDRGLHARLWHLADDDGAGGADRRDLSCTLARPDRVPAPQRARPQWPHHDWQSLHRIRPHARDPRQAREAPDLARPGAGEGARCARRQARRHGVACVTKDYVRSRLLARQDRDRPRGPHLHPLRPCRDGHGRGHRSPPCRAPSRRRSRRDHAGANRRLRRAGARHIGRSLYDGPEDAGRRRAQPTLGAVPQHGHHGVDRSPRRHASGRRGRPRHPQVRAVAGGARAVAYPRHRPQSETVGDGSLEGRAPDHAGPRAAAACEARLRAFRS